MWESAHVVSSYYEPPALVNSPVHAHSRAPENTLQNPHNTQALIPHTIITPHTKYEALPASLNIIRDSKLGHIILISSLI